jgi:hypothetical protein
MTMRLLALVAALVFVAACKEEPPPPRPAVVVVDKLAAEAAAREAMAAAQARESAREAALLRASGVEPAPPVAETAPPLESAGPGAIRVSQTQGRGPLFAACRADERLVGGGCWAPSETYKETAIRQSYPSHFGAVDTVGARWNCGGVATSDYAETDLVAYALCARLAADAPTSSAPAGR